jgi:hypothetical protein
MAKSPDRTHMTSLITDDRYEYIRSRTAQIQRYSVSMFGEDIVEWWLKMGAPPVNSEDRVIPLPKFMDRPERYTRRKRYSV